MNRLLNTKEGKILISVLWGLGLAFLFFKQTCSGDQCIVYSSPEYKVVEEGVYAHNKEKDSCYKYKTYTVECEDGESVIKPPSQKNKDSASSKTDHSFFKKP